MRKLLVFAAMVMLTGCGLERQKEIKEGVAQCRAQFPEIVGGYVARETCLNNVSERLLPQSPGNVLIQATRMNLAEKVDAGKISPSEMKVELARLVMNINDRQATIQAQEAAATAAIIGALPQPHNSTCVRSGAVTNCYGN
jgi:hypothetical protein